MVNPVVSFEIIGNDANSLYRSTASPSAHAINLLRWTSDDQDETAALATD